MGYQQLLACVSAVATTMTPFDTTQVFYWRDSGQGQMRMGGTTPIIY